MKNTLQGINSRLHDREEWISDMEDRIVEITQSEKQKEERIKKKKKGQFKGLLGYHQVCHHLHYRGLTGKKERGGRKLI